MNISTPIVVLLALLLMNSCQTERPSEKEPTSSGLKVSWTLRSNDREVPKYRASFRITNHTDHILAKQWAMYFNQMTGTVDQQAMDSRVRLNRVTGDYWKLTPTADFKSLKPGESFEFEYEMNDAISSISKTPRNVYFQIGDSKPFMGDYQMTAFDMENFEDFNPPTPKTRYQENQSLHLLKPDQIVPLTPSPQEFVLGSGGVAWSERIVIAHSPELAEEAGLLVLSLKRLFTGPVDIQGEDTEADIVLRIKPDPERSEAYELQISPGSGVVITGADRTGVFYGIQSLLGLISPALYSQAGKEIELPEIKVRDAPRFPYRGIMLDVARNFQSKKTVLKFLDLMAFYKLNKLHFHIVDDEGWRLEIQELPELTDFGSRRGHTGDEKDRLFPMFGSGPDPDSSSGTGYYTEADFTEIIQYAHQRKIEVIPEIDMPGHARAAIKSMQLRAERLKAQGQDQEANRYLLHDPDDQSKYNSAQNYNDNVVCVCQESTYAFLEVVINRVVELFNEAGAPLTTIHTGGDEVPLGAWGGSPVCLEFLKTNPEINEVPELRDYFIDRFSSIISRHGLTTAGWEEIAILKRFHEDQAGLEPNPRFLDRNFQPYVWNTTLGQGAEDLAYKLANAGYRTVMCNVANTYLDFAYDRDPMEKGLNWGGYVNTRAVFELTPFDVFQTATSDRWGNVLAEDKLRQGKVTLSQKGKGYLFGVQGQLWSELLNSQEALEHMAFPKLLGLAERAWAASPEWAEIADRDLRFEILDQSWNRFANALGQRELPRLDRLFNGVNYRIPLPGAVIKDGKLLANIAFPGLSLHYTTDGSEPSYQSSRYSGPVDVQGPVKVKIRAFSPSGRGGRVVEVSMD